MAALLSGATAAHRPMPPKITAMAITKGRLPVDSNPVLRAPGNRSNR